MDVDGHMYKVRTKTLLPVAAGGIQFKGSGLRLLGLASGLRGLRV